MKTRRTRAQWAHCMICEETKTVWWEQRGVTFPEWIRTCGDCLHKIRNPNRRNRKPAGQLDLFAK